MANGGCSQSITCFFYHSFLLRGKTPHILALFQHGVSPMGDSSPQTSSMWVLPTGCSSSKTSPAWVASMGCSPLGTDCSSVCPPRGHKPCQQTCSSAGSPRDHSLLWASTCSGMWSSPGYRRISAPLWTSMDCMGTACLTMVFITGCRGKISALKPGAPPPPPSSLTLVSAELFLPHCLTPLSYLLFCSSFFPYLKYMVSQRCYHHH